MEEGNDRLEEPSICHLQGNRRCRQAASVEAKASAPKVLGKSLKVSLPSLRMNYRGKVPSHGCHFLRASRTAPPAAAQAALRLSWRQVLGSTPTGRLYRNLNHEDTVRQTQILGRPSRHLDFFTTELSNN